MNASDAVERKGSPEKRGGLRSKGWRTVAITNLVNAQSESDRGE